MRRGRAFVGPGRCNDQPCALSSLLRPLEVVGAVADDRTVLDRLVVHRALHLPIFVELTDEMVVMAPSLLVTLSGVLDGARPYRFKTKARNARSGENRNLGLWIALESKRPLQPTQAFRPRRASVTSRGSRRLRSDRRGSRRPSSPAPAGCARGPRPHEGARRSR